MDLDLSGGIRSAPPTWPLENYLWIIRSLSIAADPPAAAQIIDMPGDYRNGACGFSFTDGHSEIHKWLDSKIGRAPILYNGNIALNVAAGDSWVDCHWMGDNATVHT